MVEPMPEEIRDSDAIHILPLSVIPLKTPALTRARLVKNTRLQSMVELFSGTEPGSGQVPVSDVGRMFDFVGDRRSDLVILDKLGGLASYDVYSLRIELPRLGIDVDSVDHLKLSAEMIAELSTYMQAFTRPLLVAIYGTSRDHQLDFREILNLFSDPFEASARRRLLKIVQQMNINLNMLPSFLERYDDVYLSLAYYQHCLDRNRPVLDQIERALRDIRASARFASDELVCDSCAYVEDKLKSVREDVTHILRMFRARTADMWFDISAAKFRANRDLVLDYQPKIGGALCALTVKADAWSETFPSPDSGGIDQRANFVRNELEQGLESVETIKTFDSDGNPA